MEFRNYALRYELLCGSFTDTIIAEASFKQSEECNWFVLCYIRKESLLHHAALSYLSPNQQGNEISFSSIRSGIIERSSHFLFSRGNRLSDPPTPPIKNMESLFNKGPPLGDADYTQHLEEEGNRGREGGQAGRRPY